MSYHATALSRALALVLAAAPWLVRPLRAQGGLDLTVDHVGLAIGDVPEVTGIRLNFRDSALRRVTGINATIWAPYDNAGSGTVNGVALGLPVTGAGQINGVATGIFGVGAGRGITGLGVAPIGIGAGDELRGIMVGGIGVGAGGGVEGLSVAGIGVGAGGDVRGISIGGIGVGGGGRVTGLTIGGIGVGAGGDLTGVNVGGVGVGSGGTVKWLSVAGVGVGAPRVEGLAAALAVGGVDVRGVAIAPAYFTVGSSTESGTLTGVAASAWNRVQGAQHGVTIGVVNTAHQLRGLQIGVVNYTRDNPRWRRLLPLVNWN